MEEVNKEAKRPALVELERRIDEYEQKAKAAYEKELDHKRRMHKVVDISYTGIYAVLTIAVVVLVLNLINNL